MTDKIRHLIFLWLIFFMPGPARGEGLKLPAILGSHMVLQQNSQVNIWGWAEPGAQVKVHTGWNHKDYNSSADSEGKWLTKVQTGPAGGPYIISVSSDTTMLLEDILLGEVWICSGQSNMEWPLSKAESATSEIPRSLDRDIRLFTVEKEIAARPREDVSGSWSICTPRAASNFSAVGYFFGKELHKDLDVPVGLVNTSWGGTPSQAWTSRETLEKFSFFTAELEEIGNISDSEMVRAEEAKDSIEMLIKVKSDFLNFDNIGFREGWMQSDLDDSQWMDVACPGGWSTNVEIGMLEGVAWMRTRFEIPESWIDKSLVIELGPVDEMDVTFLNGNKIGSHTRIEDWDTERVYKIPRFAVKSTEYLLAMRIVNTSGEGGVTGSPEQLRVYPAGGESERPVLLSGDWKFRIAYEFPEILAMSNPKTSTVLYNGMLHPLRNLTMKGVIWYQGESNISMPALYGEIFPAMIRDWRSAWDAGDFPFYFVQIAPYDYGSDGLGPGLREAQLQTLEKVPNTGMAVTMDIGDPNDIHPTNKRDVGKRLALWALANDYGRDLVCSGPLYSDHAIEGSSIRIRFKYTGRGLVARNGPPSHFEIAGIDKVFYPATAEIDGKSVKVSSPLVKSPVAVRYGWSATAAPNLFNSEGLPASSFRTDRWTQDPELPNPN